MSPTLSLVLAASAVAQPLGHYHPDDVAARSKVFVAAAEQMGPAFESAQQQLGGLGRGLQSLEVGSALLGTRVPDGFAGWSQAQRKTVTGQFLQVQRHVDLVQDDFGGVFGTALERAITAQGSSLQECTKGTGVQALMRRPGAGCPGEDRNGALARALDSDAQLKSDVAEILAIPFPELGVESRAWTPVPLTGTERWVSAAALADAHARPALERASAALEARLAPLEARMTSGDASAVTEAAAARAAYEAELAAAGVTLLDAAQRALEKAGSGGVGVCPNAETFGGCTGTDATATVLGLLAADKRFMKSAAGL